MLPFQYQSRSGTKQSKKYSTINFIERNVIRMRCAIMLINHNKSNTRSNNCLAKPRLSQLPCENPAYHFVYMFCISFRATAKNGNYSYNNHFTTIEEKKIQTSGLLGFHVVVILLAQSVHKSLSIPSDYYHLKRAIVHFKHLPTVPYSTQRPNRQTYATT